MSDCKYNVVAVGRNITMVVYHGTHEECKRYYEEYASNYENTGAWLLCITRQERAERRK